jgi:SsrA-binding protein
MAATEEAYLSATPGPVKLALCAARRKAYDAIVMARKDGKNDSPHVHNRRALHDYFIEAKLECGIALVGTEVKVLREGKAQLHDAFARIENGELWLYGLHIDPYSKAAAMYQHQPTRSRKLLAHRREIKKLENATKEKGTTLVPLSIYFKGGRAKIELGVGRGRQHHDKRNAIREKEQKRDLARSMMKRG